MIIYVLVNGHLPSHDYVMVKVSVVKSQIWRSAGTDMANVMSHKGDAGSDPPHSGSSRVPI